MSHYVITPNLVANGNILPSTFVKGDSANDQYCLQAGVGDTPIGISGTSLDYPPGVPGATANHAVATEHPLVYGMGAYCLLNGGTGGWSEFQFLKPDGSGNGIPGNPGDICGAFSVTANAGGVTSPVFVLPPGTRAPLSQSSSVVTVTANTALTAAQNGATILVNGVDLTMTLPAPAVGLSYTIVSIATSAAMQAGSVGTLLATNGTEKMFGNNFTAASSKGAVNTFSTAHQGDCITVKSDGTNWYVLSLVGTWARQT